MAISYSGASKQGASEERLMYIPKLCTKDTTVEPLNKGHFGAGHVVLCGEVVLFSEVQNILVL